MLDLTHSKTNVVSTTPQLLTAVQTQATSTSQLITIIGEKDEKKLIFSPENDDPTTVLIGTVSLLQIYSGTNWFS